MPGFGAPAAAAAAAARRPQSLPVPAKAPPPQPAAPATPAAPDTPGMMSGAGGVRPGAGPLPRRTQSLLVRGEQHRPRQVAVVRKVNKKAAADGLGMASETDLRTARHARVG